MGFPAILKNKIRHSFNKTKYPMRTIFWIVIFNKVVKIGENNDEKGSH
jgi:hypothetical protein